MRPAPAPPFGRQRGMGGSWSNRWQTGSGKPVPAVKLAVQARGHQSPGAAQAGRWPRLVEIYMTCEVCREWGDTVDLRWCADMDCAPGRYCDECWSAHLRQRHGDEWLDMPVKFWCDDCDDLDKVGVCPKCDLPVCERCESWGYCCASPQAARGRLRVAARGALSSDERLTEVQSPIVDP